MKYPRRIYYTESDKSLMWDRWQEGEKQTLAFYALTCLWVEL